MRELTLAESAKYLPAAGGAIWRGRSSQADVISIETMLEDRLLQIRKEHMEWAYAVSKLNVENGHNLQALLECGDTPSMWWTSLIYERHPRLSPYLYTIYKLRCVEMLLREKGCNALCLIGGDRKMRKALANLCRQANLEFRSLPAEQAEHGHPGLGRRIYGFLPAPVRAICRFVHWWWTIKRKIGYGAKLPAAPCARPAATIATYFPNIDMRAAGEGRFRSRYWEKLHDALNEEAEKEMPAGGHFVRWLFIRFPAPDLDLAACLRLRDLFRQNGRDGLSFNYLEEFLNNRDILAAFWRWARLCAAALLCGRKFANHCRFPKSELNFWPYMSWQWRESLAGWRSLERCLYNRAFRNYYSVAGRQRWNLFPLENCPWERMLTTAARTITDNGPVLGAQHSTIRPTDFRYFDAPQTFSAPECAIFQPNIIAGNGASACEQWRANGMPESRLAQVEALRYLYLAHTSDMEAPGNAPELPPQAGEPLEPGQGARLLILTSFFSDETEAHLNLVREALAAGILDNYRLTLKPHPYLMPRAWLESLPPGQRGRIFVSHAPLARELATAAIVWTSNSTTASLEAALKGLPVMVMLADNDFDLCPIQDVDGLPRTGTVEDVKRILDDPRPLALGQDYLDLNPDLPAWKRLLDLKN